MEHAHGFQRELVQILANQADLLEHVGGNGNNVAADFIGLEDVEKFPRAGPDELRC